MPSHSLYGMRQSSSVVLIPSWEQPVVGNLSDELGAFWELVIGSDASVGSLGIGWELGSQKISLGAKKLPAFLSDASSAYHSPKTTRGENSRYRRRGVGSSCTPTEQAAGTSGTRTRDLPCLNVMY